MEQSGAGVTGDGGRRLGEERFLLSLLSLLQLLVTTGLLDNDNLASSVTIIYLHYSKKIPPALLSKPRGRVDHLDSLLYGLSVAVVSGLRPRSPLESAEQGP